MTLSKADAKAIKKVVKNIPAVSNYDVVVIGAGGAGFSAAIEAKNAGANVVLLERCRPWAATPSFRAPK